MFTSTTRTTLTEQPSTRQALARLTRSASSRETQDMPRAEAMTPRAQAPTAPEDWTRECLFDCYND